VGSSKGVRRVLFGAALLALTLLILARANLGAFTYERNVLLRHGGSYAMPVGPTDPRLPPSVRLALCECAPPARAESFAWRTIEPGFDVAELPAVTNGVEADRVLLARIDPKRFAFIVRTQPAGDRELDDWMRDLDAVLVINGSYFNRTGAPDTPLLSDGILLGPAEYAATHGAFVASPSFAGIRDVATRGWHAAFEGATDGLVSYPLLVDAEGKSRADSGDEHWLANRSFIGEDASGNIIVGTTQEAYFSLGAFARFLHAAPLHLKLALNLDGGPVACQAIALDGFARDRCGGWELADYGGRLSMQQWVFGSARRAALPVVIAVLRRPPP
jgi:hypothetical protein